MQAIEFEAVSQNHLIRIPDNIPDGISIRVLVLVEDEKMTRNFDIETLSQPVLTQAQQRKKNLKEALNKAVALNIFDGIDGVEWQKQQRQDRMIGREEEC
jgi:hypothetical protein